MPLLSARAAVSVSRAQYVPQVMAILAAMTTPADGARAALINDLVLSLINAGVWSKLDCLWMMAAHDAQAARLNWKNPGTYNLTIGGGAPTFSTDPHYATDGVDDWLDTNFNPSTAGGNFTQNAASFGAWGLLNVQNASSAMGWFDGTDGITLAFRNTVDKLAGRLNNVSAISSVATVASGAGLSAVNRAISTQIQLYKNGAALGAPIGAGATTLNSANLRLGSITASGFCAAQFSCAFVGGNLTATEHGALYTAVNTYLTAV